MISPKLMLVPLGVVSKRGGALNGGRPWDVFPVMVKTGEPNAFHENARKVAATTTNALRTEVGRHTHYTLSLTHTHTHTHTPLPLPVLTGSDAPDQTVSGPGEEGVLF